MKTLTNFSRLQTKSEENVFTTNVQMHGFFNFNSVPQVTELLLGDAKITSKTEPRNGSMKEKRSYGKVRNNKTMLKILSFIQTLYLKEQYSDTFLQFKI